MVTMTCKLEKNRTDSLSLFFVCCFQQSFIWDPEKVYTKIFMAAEGPNPQGSLCSDKAGFDYTHSVSLLCVNLTYQRTKLLILQVRAITNPTKTWVIQPSP